MSEQLPNPIPIQVVPGKVDGQLQQPIDPDKLRLPAGQLPPQFSGHQDGPVVLKAPEVGRLGVTGFAYHQGTGPSNTPAAFELRWARPCQSDEQPYLRLCKVGPDWVPLDLGWFKLGSAPLPVGAIGVSNEEGKQWQVIPTPEERAAVMARVLQISLRDPPQPDLIVPATEAHVFLPADPSQVKVRAVGLQDGQVCKASIIVYPK